MKYIITFFLFFSLFPIYAHSCWKGFNRTLESLTSGTPELDEAVLGISQKLNSFWNLSSQYIYYSDEKGSFMYCPKDKIYLSNGMLKKVTEEDPSKLTLEVFLAHESAHHVQYVYSPEVYKTKNNVQIELQADCLACFYIGISKEVSSTDLTKVLDSLKKNSGNTHGSSKQRVSYCKYGFDAGKYVKENKIVLSPEDILGSRGICK